MRDIDTYKQSKEKGGTNMKKVHNMSKSIMSFVLAFAMAATMLIAAPAKEAKAAYAAPTGTTTLTNEEHPEITGVTVEGVDADVSFQQDNNGVNATFIRILLPSDTTVSTLQSMDVTINTNPALSNITWDSSLDVDGEAGEYTCYETDLYNKSYTISLGGKTYILAAGIASAKMDVPSKETNIIKYAKLGNGKEVAIATNMQRDIIQSDYMGNPYFGEMGYDWTSVTYILTSETLPNTLTRNAVVLSYTLNGKADKATVDLTSGQKAVTINGVAYQVTASFGDVIVVSKDNYKIDLSELYVYWAGEKELAAPREDIYHMWQQIMMAQDAYFQKGARTFAKGTTVMDVMQDFLTFACGESEDNSINFFTMGESSRGADVSYIDYINGLSYRQVNRKSGWMYSDSTDDVFDNNGNFIKGSSMPGVMASAYIMTKDTKITWFFTTDYTAY
ncbi:DUF4430 domain-containing protein [Clostridiaceae bacterium AM27-36LB]|nr:DUF4430 domain-containing protein [Clostridiales bacterium AM23-16LB]RHT85584.1 DUF4430 domain-containing protein [Clostridiaceae bacterium AM27-36LB]RHW02782.1 DUF4430 domain-containing protein [Clostridiaceae bacterium OF09-1]